MIKNTTGLQSGTILDIGCGTGAFLHTMKQAGWNITGLEPDETARKNALSLYNIDPLPPGELFNLPKDSFDVITAWHVMEHVHQLHEYIDSLKRILAPGGKIFIAVPNHTSYDALGYKSFWAAWDVPRHLYHFSPQSMHILMQIHGLTIQEISPMWFDSFYVCMLSEQYKNGKGNIIRAFYNGMISNMKALPDKQNCSSLIYVISNKEVK